MSDYDLLKMGHSIGGNLYHTLNDRGHSNGIRPSRTWANTINPLRTRFIYFIQLSLIVRSYSLTLMLYISWPKLFSLWANTPNTVTLPYIPE